MKCLNVLCMLEQFCSMKQVYAIGISRKEPMNVRTCVFNRQ